MGPSTSVPEAARDDATRATRAPAAVASFASLPASFPSESIAASAASSLLCVIITTSGMLQCSRHARITPADMGSSVWASSTNNKKPGREGCAGAACTDRPRRSRSSISASVLHRPATLSRERNACVRVCLRRCNDARKRRLWSRRCTPLRCRVNATALVRRPATKHSDSLVGGAFRFGTPDDADASSASESDRSTSSSNFSSAMKLVPNPSSKSASVAMGDR